MSIYTDEMGPMTPELRPCSRDLYFYAQDTIDTIEKLIAEEGEDPALQVCMQFVERLISPYDRTEVQDESIPLLTLDPHTNPVDAEVDILIEGFLNGIPNVSQATRPLSEDVNYESFVFTYKYHQDGTTRDVNKIARVTSEDKIYYSVTLATIGSPSRTSVPA